VELYRSDLRRVQPVSDAQILAAMDRAEAHDLNQIPAAAGWALPRTWGSYTTRGPQSSFGRSSTHSRPLAV